MNWSNEGLQSVRSKSCLGVHLSILAILMAIAGPCSNSPVAPSFQADARSAASGVEDDSTAALSPMKAYEEHRISSAFPLFGVRKCCRRRGAQRCIPWVMRHQESATATANYWIQKA